VPFDPAQRHKRLTVGTSLKHSLNYRCLHYLARHILGVMVFKKQNASPYRGPLSVTSIYLCFTGVQTRESSESYSQTTHVLFLCFYIFFALRFCKTLREDSNNN